MQEPSKGWPRAETASEHAACHFCDSLQKVVSLEEGKDAHCSVCGGEMYENRKQSLQRTISFSLSALLLMVLVIIFPFLSLNRSGLKSSMTVWEAATSLWEQGDQMISVATAVFIVFLPSLLILSLLYVTIPLSLGKSLPGMVAIFRVVSMLKPWAMVEVFFLGALVSLLKLVKLADIAIGVGFWAFALLMISMVGALGSVNYFEYWDRIEAVRERMRKETFS